MYSSGMDDVFSAIFGGGGGGVRGPQGYYRQRQRQRAHKGDDVMYTLPVALEDLYAGKEITLRRQRTVLCDGCGATGAKAGVGGAPANNVCSICRGSGARVVVRQMGMMVQQMRVVCDRCDGAGELIDPRHRCTECQGNKTKEVEAPMSVTIEPGMRHGLEIRFPGMAHDTPAAEMPGDYIVKLQQMKHSVFARNDCDLHMSRRITLAEALCGFQFKLTQLDGRVLIVRRPRGEITRPGAVLCVPGEGMPIYKGNRFGDLVIEFEVEYPDHMEPSQVVALREALPPPKSVDAARSGAAAGDKTEEDADNVRYVTREHLDTLRAEIAKEEETGGGQRGDPSAGCRPQ